MALAFALTSSSTFLELDVILYTAHIKTPISSVKPITGITSGIMSTGDIKYPKAPIIIALSNIDTFGKA